MRFLTVQEVSEMLKISRSLVYQLVESKELPSHRVGNGRGSIRIAEEDLQEYLAARRTEKGEKKPSPPRPRLKHIKL